MSYLALRGLTKLYVSGTKKSGVEKIDLDIREGEFFSLLGPSGSGKTTLLRLLGGFENPDFGQILHRGEDITPKAPFQRSVRTVFQKYALFPHLDVFENVAFSLRLQRKALPEINSRVNELLDLLEITHIRNRSVDKLSGGEQQRVALARALASRPEILLLDEPFSALDLKLREKMQLELLSLKKKLNVTMIFVTHDQGEAMFLSDRIAILNGGLLEQVASPQELYQSPKTRFVASFVGQANFLNGRHESSLIASDEMKNFWTQSSVWMLRPEFIRLVWQKPDVLAEQTYYIPATVEEKAYLGDSWLLKCLVPDNKDRIFLKVPTGSKIPELDTTLFLSWDRAQLCPVE
ncbi:MAG: ABC transporter ATP-binding protein [Proteobacteria bacterium]|nr:ABC transporter ATP-binding protein [Pseudomonadota bacterium]